MILFQSRPGLLSNIGIENSTYKVEPVHLSVTGRGSCGKSHSLKIIKQSLKISCIMVVTQTIKGSLLLIPTGVAAVKIDSTTIHSDLTINFKGQFYSVNAKQKGSL